ncbi:hypothetical protein L2E82_48645 [Cichorium intybus]|uniref:Uncharacterized protein n=1 Tax=Cichorium intybus TaxID=13427 RepID=A0ACB8YXS1_CICIN|nr:hypothetical protein L2E82_48645 [Cichorium intybus]
MTDIVVSLETALHYQDGTSPRSDVTPSVGQDGAGPRSEIAPSEGKDGAGPRSDIAPSEGKDGAGPRSDIAPSEGKVIDLGQRPGILSTLLHTIATTKQPPMYSNKASPSHGFKDIHVLFSSAM